MNYATWSDHFHDPMQWRNLNRMWKWKKYTFLISFALVEGFCYKTYLYDFLCWPFDQPFPIGRGTSSNNWKRYLVAETHYALELELTNMEAYSIQNPIPNKMSIEFYSEFFPSNAMAKNMGIYFTWDPTEFVGDNGDGVLPFGTSENPPFDRYSLIVFWHSLTSARSILYNFK